MVTASHSLCSCLQANFHPPYAHPIKLQTDLKQGQNPSCLGTLLGPAAHPSLGALRALQLGLRPNKIVEEGGVCAMVKSSLSQGAAKPPHTFYTDIDINN